MITAKIIVVPGTVQEVALNDDATVADALAAASITQGAGMTLTVNGNAANDSTVLTDGARVILTKEAKGAIAA